MLPPVPHAQIRSPGSAPPPAHSSPLLAAPGQTAQSLRDSFVNFGRAFEDRLPWLLLAVICLVATVLAARLVRRAVRAGLRRTSAETHVYLLLGKLAYLGVMLVGVLVALSVAGVNVAVLVGSLGLATVAVGFGLQDILSNFVAGIVLLLEHPFTVGDLISAPDAEGTVEDIRVRATQLRAADGRIVIVPNKLLFTGVLTNASATVRRRLAVTVHVPYAAEPARVRQALIDAASGVDGVVDDPAPSTLTQDVGQDALELLLWCWVDPRTHDLQQVRGAVLEQAEEILHVAGEKAGTAADARADTQGGGRVNGTGDGGRTR